MKMEKATQKLLIQLKKLKRLIGGISKDDTNSFHKYNFRGIDAVMEATAPAFDRCDLIPSVRIRTTEYHAGASVRAVAHCTITLHSLDGGCIKLSGPGEGMDKGDKAVMKAASVAYRDTLLRGLQIPTQNTLLDSEADSSVDLPPSNDVHPVLVFKVIEDQLKTIRSYEHGLEIANQYQAELGKLPADLKAKGRALFEQYMKPFAKPAA